MLAGDIAFLKMTMRSSKYLHGKIQKLLKKLILI